MSWQSRTVSDIPGHVNILMALKTSSRQAKLDLFDAGQLTLADLAGQDLGGHYDRPVW